MTGARPSSRPDQLWVVKHLDEVLAALRELREARARIAELEAEAAAGRRLTAAGGVDGDHADIGAELCGDLHGSANQDVAQRGDGGGGGECGAGGADELVVQG